MTMPAATQMREQETCPTLSLSERDPSNYAFDLPRGPGANPIRRDPPSRVVREQARCRLLHRASPAVSFSLFGLGGVAGRRFCLPQVE